MNHEQPHNELSPAEAERLALLMEEMAEAQQVIGKILRHGYGSYHPDAPRVSNRQLLEKEMGHVMAALSLSTLHGDLDKAAMRQHTDDKGISVQRYLHHN